MSAVVAVAGVELSVAVLLALAVAAVAAGAVQAALGFGAGFVLVPSLAFAAPRVLPGAVIVAIVPLSAAMVLQRRRTLDVRAIGRVTAGRLPGIAAGGALVGVLATDALTVAIAALLLLAVLVAASGVRVPVTPRTEVLAGAASGLSGTAAGLGGPPLALLYRGSGGERLRGTLAGVWLIGAAPALGSLAWFGALDLAQVQVGAVLGALVVLGLLVAAPVVARVDDARLRRLVLVYAAAGAVAAVARVVTTW